MDAAERAFLRQTRRGYLATADGEGRPAAVPVCFALVDDGGADGRVDDGGRDEGHEDDADPWIATPLDEKPKAAEPRQLRRVRDVTANPRVALVVDRYDENWSNLAWVQLRGTAAMVAPGERGHAVAVGALREKYDQYADHALEERPLLRVAPGHVVSWAAADDVASE
jgi:PPOX class probable F420-dependent enzyme